MKKNSKLIVSFPGYCKKILKDMKLRTLFLLFGAIPVFYASNAQDNSMVSSNIKTIDNLTAYVTNPIITSGSLTINTNIGIAEDLQQKRITGSITDKDALPLPGVNILEKGTINGAISDVNGKFSISVASVNSVLVFSFVGYTSQEITVGSQTTVNVALAESAIGLDEIVVVGYGTQQKRDISGSVTSISEKSFNTGITRTAVDLLQGKVAGLTITQGSGDVTQTQTMRLRGTSSLTGSSEPFVVIDGVPGMSLNSVAPQDIESISILKDASASAIYGSRSGSGVILITTKKGRAGKVSIDYNAYVAYDVVTNKPDVLTAAEWRKYCADKGINTSTMDKGANTDWFGEILRTGFTQNHDLSFSGGGNNNSYRASVSYLDQQGVAKDNYQDRLNTRLSFNQKALKDHLDISVIGTLNQRNYQPANTNNFILAYNMIPVVPVKNDDGTWYESRDYDQGNPVRNQELNSNKYINTLFMVNLKANLEITRNFFASINVLKQGETLDRSVYNDNQTQAGYSALGFGQREFTSNKRKLLETTLNYSGTLNDHKLNVLAGYSYEDFYSQYANAQNRQFVTNLFGPNNLSSGENLLVGDASSSATMNRLISFFGRINYSFKDRYLLAATLRQDGSSKFGLNNKWGTFPSVSVAWRLSDESFMQSFSGVLDELKLRVGYGISGNQDGLDPYQSMQLYGSSGTYFDNGAWHTAYGVKQNANPDLKWEQTAMFNVGVDYSLFDGRLNGTIEYYDKRTSDLLYKYPVPVPPYLYSSIVANVGTMQNKGIEILLNGDVIRTKDLRWNIGINAAHNDNMVLKLSNTEYTTASLKVGSVFIRGGSDNPTHIIEEGRPVGTFYGYKCLGIDESGNYILDDMVNGVAGLTDEDRTYIGNAQPKLTYGIDNSITYKDLEFSFFIRGVYGNDVLNFSKLTYETTQWLPGANVLASGLTTPLRTSPIYTSLAIEKASFARVDNMNIAYSIYPNVLGINKFRFNFTIHNLFTLTKYKGVDPEVPMSGLDPGIEGRYYYPKSRTFVIGINASF